MRQLIDRSVCTVASGTEGKRVGEKSIVEIKESIDYGFEGAQ